MKAIILTSIFALTPIVACDQQAYGPQEPLSTEDFEGMTPEEIEVLQAELEETEAPISEMDDLPIAAATDVQAATCVTRRLFAIDWNFCQSSVELLQRAYANCHEFGVDSWTNWLQHYGPCDYGYRAIKFQCCRLP